MQKLRCIEPLGGGQLAMSERQFRRNRARYEEDGEDGLRDRRLGKPSPKRVPEAEVSWMLKLYREAYRGWNVKPITRRHRGGSGRGSNKETEPSNQSTDEQRHRDRSAVVISITPGRGVPRFQTGRVTHPRSGQLTCYENRTS
jgi:hypothetical protein